MIGVNGLCSVYDPPVSYWCSAHTSGGGAFAFRTPSGVTPKADALPHSPYTDVSQVRQLRHYFGPSHACLAALHHPTRAMCYALLSAHAGWVLIGLWDPTL